MPATLSKQFASDFLEDAYKSVRKMITKIVINYKKTRGGEYDELMSVAREYFVLATQDWNPNKSGFTTYVYWRVYYGLLSEAAKIHKQIGFLQDDNRERVDDNLIESRSSFNIKTFLEEISDEAREVANIALELSSKRKKPIKLKKLAEILTETGWAASEILHAFKELRDALC